MVEVARDVMIRRWIRWSNPFSKALSQLIPYEQIRNTGTLVKVYHEHFTSSRTIFASRPSSQHKRNKDRSLSGGQGRRTFYDDVHLIVHFLQFVSDTSYFIIDRMRKFQDLCSRHSSLLLRQFVQPL